MATGKESAKQPGDSQGLKNAVASEAKQAEDNARTGNVATVKETAKQPSEDLPTNTRRLHPAE